MGLKVVPRKKKPLRKVFFINPSGNIGSSVDMSNEDADILIKYKAIKSDPIRYENAKRAMKMRGY